MPRQLTFGRRHHVLDNNDNFSPDDRWLAVDTRDARGIAANAVIGRVEVASGRFDPLHVEPAASPWGPGVGAANYSSGGEVAFIRGLGGASADRPYELWRRTGAMVRPGPQPLAAPAPLRLQFLDARDVRPPFTPGALRGGTHRHEWSADGDWIGFTYNDAVLAELEAPTGTRANLRTVGVAARAGGPVRVPPGPENLDGEMFAAVVVAVTPDPAPGSDEISAAIEDAWVGRAGYTRADGGRQRRARAFLGAVRGRDGRECHEVFVVDIPEDLTRPGPGGPLEGTATAMPAPPWGTAQRRLTRTAEWTFPGVAREPRHWVRSSPQGDRIVFLARDEAGRGQAFFVSPRGGAVTPVTRESHPIQSCVRWSPDGAFLLYVCGGALRVCGARPGTADFGRSWALTAPADPAPVAPVWSNDGRTIAFNREVDSGGGRYLQIFLVPAPAA